MKGNRYTGRHASPLSLTQKRRFLLGMSEGQIRELRSAGRSEDFEDLGHQTGLSAGEIERLVADVQSLTMQRMDPNRLTRKQLEQIPGLTAVQLSRILLGKPYYSLEELEAASNLLRPALGDLFEVRPFRYQDPIAGREIILEPVSGRYIVPPSEVETDPALAAGYGDIYAPSPRVGFRVVEALDYEAGPRSHELKKEFKGQVYPVLRDAEGFERYLAPGMIDVWFGQQVPTATRAAVLEELHLRVVQSVPEVGYYRSQLDQRPENVDLIHAALDVITRASQYDEVLFAEPDQLGFEDFDPDRGEGQVEQEFEALDVYWNEEIIDLAGAHAITKGSPDVTVFVVDSGCDMDHQTLVPGFRSDWERLDLSFDLDEAPEVTSPNEDVISHGTKVAGVVRRVAPQCRILPIKIPGNSGGSAAPGYGLRAAAILKALDYLTPGKHAVMNLSWKTNGEHIGIREALRSAEVAGLVLVASAGNYAPGDAQQPDDLHYPSAHSYRAPVNTALLSVAALGPSDVRASYSYYGAESITVSAPGGERGGIGSGIYTTTTPSGHTCVAGTSFAAPHVAALAALLFSAKPALGAEQVIAHIKASAESVDAASPGFVGQLGAGRINAQAALEQVAGPATTHTVTATAEAHGAVVPEGTVSVPQGGSQRFEFVPDPGYTTADVLLDSASIGAPISHTLTNVSRDHSLTVSFAELAADEQPENLVNVNVNMATAEALEALPYIGSWRAGQIVSYRQAHGPYGSIWDLRALGMSDWAIGHIASMITV